MGSYANFVRGIVKNHRGLKLKLKKAGSKLTPFQYIHQTIAMTTMSVIVLGFILFVATKSFFFFMLISEVILVFFGSFIIYKFWVGFVDVQIRKYAREVDGDLLFVSEFFLVNL